MLIHACKVHAGEIITPAAQAKLTNAGRGMCSTEGCDALRKYSERLCRKCKLYADVRLFQDGDRVPAFSARPGPSLTQESRVLRVLFGDDEPHPIDGVDADLPDDFEERVDKLSSQTMLWPPLQFRHALCGWAAGHVEAMNRVMPRPPY